MWDDAGRLESDRLVMIITERGYCVRDDCHHQPWWHEPSGMDRATGIPTSCGKCELCPCVEYVEETQPRSDGLC